jgi:hypothetical protein
VKIMLQSPFEPFLAPIAITRLLNGSAKAYTRYGSVVSEQANQA